MPEYREIEGFPGYRVGDDSTVWTCRKFNRNPQGEWRPLKVYVGKNGYPVISLQKDGRKYTRTVHTLILTAFKGPAPPNMECRHLDGNPLNSRLDNLAWGTHRENGEDMILHGSGRSAQGSRHRDARLTEEDIPAIVEAYNCGETARSIGLRYGVTKGAILDVLSRDTWKHVARPVTQARVVTKLTARDVTTIKERVALGESQGSVAKSYGLNPSTVSRIVSGHRRRETSNTP